MLWFAFAKNKVTVWRDHYPSDVACAEAVGTLRRHFAGSQVDVRESTMPVVEIEPLPGDETPEFKPPPLPALGTVPMSGEPVESIPGMLTVTTEMQGKPPMTATMISEPFPDFEAVQPAGERTKGELVWQTKTLWGSYGMVEPRHNPSQYGLYLVLSTPFTFLFGGIFMGLGTNGYPYCEGIGEVLLFCAGVTFLIGFLGLPYWIIQFIETLAGYSASGTLRGHSSPGTFRHRSRN